MNFLEMPSFKSQKSLPKMKLVVNTFTGNEKESERSEEIKRIIKSKNYKISELIDINQELIFEKDKKNFHRNFQLYKINSDFSLPQIKIGCDLVLSYEEFTILNESGLFDKMMNRSICTHIRIFNSEIVYSHSTLEEFSCCVYCSSKRKKKQTITLISDLRNYKDQEINEILSFIEGNNLTVKLIDFENYFNQEENSAGININQIVEKREKVFIIDQEVFQLSEFFEIIEKRVLKNIWNLVCFFCGKKLNIHIDNYKCISCLAGNDSNVPSISNIIDKNNMRNSQINKFNKKINNPYHFVQKLNLNNKLDFIANSGEEIEKYLPSRLCNLNK